MDSDGIERCTKAGITAEAFYCMSSGCCGQGGIDTCPQNLPNMCADPYGCGGGCSYIINGSPQLIMNPGLQEKSACQNAGGTWLDGSEHCCVATAAECIPQGGLRPCPDLCTNVNCVHGTCEQASAASICEDNYSGLLCEQYDLASSMALC
jgi:hypothetical protein